jgi:hypothetical protein
LLRLHRASKGQSPVKIAGALLSELPRKQLLKEIEYAFVQLALIFDCLSDGPVNVPFISFV